MDADPKAFDRIVSNPVVNAVRYAQAHGGELVYQRAHPHGARFERSCRDRR